ncbi:MAG: glycogen-binding domain-containing protein [Candidatus Eisenbacteria bacterium]|nr:glycogen-binding domain-containing protein [Candidatus Eisenbacteria bacterium]
MNASMRRRAAGAVVLVSLLAATAVSPCRAEVTKTPSGIQFAYEEPSAGSVSLVGSFNDWNKAADPMTRDQEGVWRVTVALQPGKHEYKFLVNDSNYMADPDNPVVVGDYGNSQIEVGPDGDLVWGAGAAKFSNTALSSKVALNGFFRATYPWQSDADDDARLRLKRPDHDLNLDVNVKVNDSVQGSGRLRLDTSLGDVQETQGRLYSAHLDLLTQPFDLKGYYNEEVLAMDDPLELAGHEDLAGTIREEEIDFGRGTQGAVARVRGLGVDGTAFFSNTYDFDRFSDPGIYDNTDTDVMGARLVRDLVPDRARLGLSWVRRQNGWWVDFVSGANHSADIDSFWSACRAAGDSTPSDWFELGTVDQTFAVDLGLTLPGALDCAMEYAQWRWEARWDVGNRERLEGTNEVNGALDLPIGEDNGWRFKAVLSGGGPAELEWELGHEVERYDGMDDGELYVDFCRPEFADPAVNTFVGIGAVSGFSIEEYPAPPKRRNDITELDLGFKLLNVNCFVEVDRRNTSRKYEYATSVTPDAPVEQTNEAWRIAPGASVSLMGGRLSLGIDYEQIDNDPEGAFFFSAPLDDPCGVYYYDTRELIFSGRFAFTERVAAVWDVRRMVYEANPGQEPPPEEAYVSPYLALVYSPVKSVEVRLGYHVNPVYYIDAPLEGRGNGRQVWRDVYMWEHGASVFDAERALTDVKMVSLMGVISF